MLSFYSACCESVHVLVGFVTISELTNFVKFASFLALGGSSAVWDAAPMVRGRLNKLEHLVFR